MNSRNLLAAACAVSAVAAAPSAASAATAINGSVSSISVQSSDPGLVLNATAIAFSPFILGNVGDTFTTDVLTIGTDETTVNFDDAFSAPVSVTFTFSSPAGSGGTATGSSNGFFQFFPVFNSCGIFTGGCGQVLWNNPTLINFGAGGQFSITLSNARFGTPGTANVSAQFELISNAVPEPSTWAMLILGFGVVGGAMRQSRKQKQRLTYA